MIFDLHAHYLSPSVPARAAAGDLPVRYDLTSRRLGFPSGSSRPVPAALIDLADRRRWMKDREIRRQMLSPWMDITGDDLPGREAEQWCRALNDGTAADIGDDESFLALAALPVVDGRRAGQELRRCVTEKGFKGGALPTQINGTDLDKAGLDPLWETAESLGAILFIHPFRVMGADRMQSHFLGNVCGNPFETTLAALRLYFGGIFARWPRLKILLAHGGGALPYLAGRAVHASKNAPGFDRVVEHPDAILGAFYYDTLLHDPRALGHLIATVGADRVAAGTDYPFPMSLDDPIAHIKQAVGSGEGEDDHLLDKVFQGTAESLGGC